MSRAYLNFSKKNNPLAAVINKRSISPSLTSRQQTQRDTSFAESETTKKLYTFCSSQNKPLSQEKVNDENKASIINLTQRQRKISLNNIKGKVYENPAKIQLKGTNQAIQKDKKKMNNLTIASITSINAAFDRRKTQRPVTARNEEKKINISVCINPKTFREGEERKASGRSKEKQNSSLKKSGLFDKKNAVSKINIEDLKQISQAYNESGKTKVVIQEEELTKFTQKFAQEKFKAEEKITFLQSRLAEYQKMQKTWQKKYEQCIEYYEHEKEDYVSQIMELKQQLKHLKHDNQYYIMAKDQARKTIKEQEKEIDYLNKQIQELKDEVVKYKECSLLSYESKSEHKEMKNALRLLEIENSHLRKELEIIDNYKEEVNIQKTYSSLRSNKEEDTIIKLSQENFKLKNQLKDSYMEKIHSDIYRKTIEQCTSRIATLQQQNQFLKNNKLCFQQCQSVKKPHPLTQLKFRAVTSDNKASISSPSEVQYAWKREQADQFSKSRSFGIGHFDPESSHEWR